MLSLPAGRGGRRWRLGSLPGCVGSWACWREIAGISDGLLAAEGQAGDGGSSPRRADDAGLSLDEGLLGSWTGPFGWLVVAEPVTPGELRGLAEDVGVRQRVAEGSADRFPERAAQARRLKERHAELQRGESGGFWRITRRGGRGRRGECRAGRRAVLRVDGSRRAAVCAQPGAGSARPGRLRRPSSRAATASRPRRSTGRPSCLPRLPGRRRRRCPGCASRCGRTST